MDASPSLPVRVSCPAPAHQSRSLRGLVAIAVAVAAVHLWLLQGIPQARAFAKPAPTQGATPAQAEQDPPGPAAVFSTRTVEAAAPTQTHARPVSIKKPAVAQEDTAHNATKDIAPNNIPQPVELQIAAAPQAPAEPPAAPTASAAPALPAYSKPGLPNPTSPIQNHVIPPSSRLSYDVKGESKNFPYSYSASGEIAWVHDESSYEAKMEFKHFLAGSRTQTSKGQLTALGLEPTRFGDKFRSEVAAHFERAKGKVIFSANTPDAALLSGAQDHLSVLFQLASMLGGAPTRFGPGSSIAFQAVGQRSAESWVFVVGQLEKLNLPGGEVNAVKLVRDPNGEYDTRLELWLAPSMSYLPVRIKLTESNGNTADQLWSGTKSP